MLFPFKRQAIWNNFIEKVTSERKIDARSYWEFREFYSPGYFRLTGDTINEKEAYTALQSISGSINKKGITYPFAVFTSPRLKSVDALSSADSLSEVLTNRAPPDAEILFEGTNSLVYKKNKTVTILFLMPENEMRRTVGFFEYDGKDKELTGGKKWLNVTSLQLD